MNLRRNDRSVYRCNCTPKSYLILVARIERNLNHFLVLTAELHHIAEVQLTALDNSRLGRIANTLALQDWPGHILLAVLDDSPIAQRATSHQSLEALRTLGHASHLLELY